MFDQEPARQVTRQPSARSQMDSNISRFQSGSGDSFSFFLLLEGLIIQGVLPCARTVNILWKSIDKT